MVAWENGPASEPDLVYVARFDSEGLAWGWKIRSEDLWPGEETYPSLDAARSMACRWNGVTDHWQVCRHQREESTAEGLPRVDFLALEEFPSMRIVAIFGSREELRTRWPRWHRFLTTSWIVYLAPLWTLCRWITEDRGRPVALWPPGCGPYYSNGDGKRQHNNPWDLNYSRWQQ